MNLLTRIEKLSETARQVKSALNQNKINPCPFTEEQARMLAKTVSVDKTNCSVSFNEFLKLMSTQQEAEPDHETLVDVFA